MTRRFSEDDEPTRAGAAETDGSNLREARIRATDDVSERREHVQAVAASSERARSRYAEVLNRLGR